VSHGLMRFMRAHGQTPGPGERPAMAGALAGLLSGVAAIPLLEWSQAFASLTHALDAPSWTRALYPLLGAAAGMVYGAVFRRAANDPRGGWLFGISYGFVLWMLGPIALLQTVLGHPLATGTAAMGILGGNLVSGLALGLLFRPMHRLVRGRTVAVPEILRDLT
jgi:hypothetical protein